MSNSSVNSVKITTNGPVAKDFNDKELKRIDIDGLQRTYLTIKWNKLSDEVYFAMRDIAASQYRLPMKYLKPVPNTYSYVSQKSQISGKEKDLKNANTTIEPLNADFFNMISYTPINQGLPNGTIVTIDVKTEFDSIDGQEPERKFIWSNNLKTDHDIEQKIKHEKPKSISTKPWIGCCHYGAIDIGSRLTAKFEVQNIDTEITHSFSLYGFSRSDERKEFTIWTYKCFNMTPIEVLQLIAKHPKVEKETVDIINEIIKKSQ